jgi:hypothetical protein
MIAGDESCHGNIVQQTRHDDPLVEPRLTRQPCALQKVVRYHRHEAVPEKVREPWLGGHLRKSRVIAHHKVPAVPERRENVKLSEMRVLSHRANRRS